MVRFRSIVGALICLSLACGVSAVAAETPPAPGSRTMPDYPAAGAGREGKVTVRFTIGVDGAIHDAVVEHSDPPGVFDAAALAAVATWRYTPRMVDGVPAVTPGAGIVLTFKPPEMAPPKAKLIRGDAPLYPVPALNQGLEGTVRLRLDVNAVGRPENIMVLDQVAGGALDKAAIESVEGWVFAAPEVDGQPHGVDDVVVAVPFRLAEAEVAPTVLSIGKGRYPPMASGLGINGDCKGTVQIADDGTVSSVTLVYCVPAGFFEAAAATAFKSWRFAPPGATPGVHVRRTFSARYRFRISGSPPDRKILRPGEWIKVSYTLATNGDTKDVRVAAQSGPDINTSGALANIRRMRFQPATEGGVAVEKPNQIISIYGAEDN